jgi:hypothetical protein
LWRRLRRVRVPSFRGFPARIQRCSRIAYGCVKDCSLTRWATGYGPRKAGLASIRNIAHLCYSLPCQDRALLTADACHPLDLPWVQGNNALRRLRLAAPLSRQPSGTEHLARVGQIECRRRKSCPLVRVARSGRLKAATKTIAPRAGTAPTPWQNARAATGHLRPSSATFPTCRNGSTCAHERAGEQDHNHVRGLIAHRCNVANSANKSVRKE